MHSIPVKDCFLWNAYCCCVSLSLKFAGAIPAFAHMCANNFMCGAFSIPIIVDVRYLRREFSTVVIVIYVVKKRPQRMPESFV